MDPSLEDAPLSTQPVTGRRPAGSGALDPAVAAMAAHMRFRNYRAASISAYTRCVRDLARVHPQGLATLSRPAILAFLQHRRDVDQISGAYQRLYNHAFRYLFGRVLGRPDVADDLPVPRAPRAPRGRPYVPTRTEVGRLIGGTRTARDHAFLSLAYATGMRVSELVRLQIHHIDARAGLIRVVDGKGGRDRVVPLSTALLRTLRAYWAETRPARPWLFGGRDPTCHLSIGGGQDLVRRAVRQAGLTPAISVHCLRHACASHMLEDGYDIVFVQNVLGHTRLTTTAQYLRFDPRRLRHAPGPLDRLLQRAGRTDLDDLPPSTQSRGTSLPLPPLAPPPAWAPWGRPRQ